jgi:hypothetical protein
MTIFRSSKPWAWRHFQPPTIWAISKMTELGSGIALTVPVHLSSYCMAVWATVAIGGYQIAALAGSGYRAVLINSRAMVAALATRDRFRMN